MKWVKMKRKKYYWISEDFSEALVLAYLLGNKNNINRIQAFCEIFSALWIKDGNLQLDGFMVSLRRKCNFFWMYILFSEVRSLIAADKDRHDYNVFLLLICLFLFFLFFCCCFFQLRYKIYVKISKIERYLR